MLACILTARSARTLRDVPSNGIRLDHSLGFFSAYALQHLCFVLLSPERSNYGARHQVRNLIKANLGC